MSRRIGTPDPELGSISYLVTHTEHLVEILTAANLPPTLERNSVSVYLSEHGFYKDGCRGLLRVLEGIGKLERTELLKKVRAYNLKNDPLRHEEREMHARITSAVSSIDTGTGGNMD